VQLVSTLSLVTQGQVDSTVVQKAQEVHPRFEGYCSLVSDPDKNRAHVKSGHDSCDGEL